MSRLVGGADARVCLNGRKQGRPGSLQRVLNSEVGDFSSLRSLRFNCSECSWRRVTACTDRRMTAWQVYRGEERTIKKSHLQGLSDMSLKHFPSLIVKCPHYCLIFHMRVLDRYYMTWWLNIFIQNWIYYKGHKMKLPLDYSFKHLNYNYIVTGPFMVSSHADNFNMICAWDICPKNQEMLPSTYFYAHLEGLN